MRNTTVTWMPGLALALALTLAVGAAGCDEPASTDETDLPVDTDDDTDPDTSLPDPEWLAINEFMASNAGSLELEDGSTPDWIELANGGDADVSLEGWSISDDLDRPRRHTFGDDLVVPAGGFLLLYADDGATTSYLGFGLKAEGEVIALTDPYGRRIDGVKFGAQQPDVSAARVIDGDPDSDWRYVIDGTPGAANDGS